MTKNAADKAAIAHIRTYDSGTDTDNITSRGDIVAGPKAQGNVRAAGYVWSSAWAPMQCIEDTCCVVNECVITIGRVVVTGCVDKERLKNRRPCCEIRLCC